MTDEDIAERIVIILRKSLAEFDDPVHRSIAATDLLEMAESYRQAFTTSAVAWMEMRREATPIRKLVFRKLGLNDYSCIEK